ncbi:MAG: hypothetical protein HC848_08770 [Limnobacter sp.]|nr:hypothetical protein [Limnobacter sp.]
MKNVHVKSLCALALLSFSLPGVCSTAESEPAHIAKETPATPPKNAAEQQTKSLENSPQTLEKLRLLLKKGIPEHMTIRVSGGGTTTPTVQTAAMGGEAQQAETPNTEAPHSTTAHTTQPAHIAVPGTRKNTKEAGEQHGEWSYSGNTGPAHWHTLGPENALCNKGQMQSPVHIQTQEAIALPLEPIEWHYGKLAGNLTNNGHTLQVD